MNHFRPSGIGQLSGEHCCLREKDCDFHPDDTMLSRQNTKGALVLTELAVSPKLVRLQSFKVPARGHSALPAAVRR